MIPAKLFNRLTKREKALSIAIITLLGLIFLHRVVFHPIMDRLSNLSRQILLKEKELTKGIRLSSQKEVIINEYKKYEKYLATKGANEEIVANILSEMEKMARSNKATVLDIKPREIGQKIGRYKRYIVELKLDATMEQLINFLYSFYTSDLLLEMERLDISVRDTSTGMLKAAMLVEGMAIQ